MQTIELNNYDSIYSYGRYNIDLNCNIHDVQTVDHKNFIEIYLKYDVSNIFCYSNSYILIYIPSNVKLNDNYKYYKNNNKNYLIIPPYFNKKFIIVIEENILYVFEENKVTKNFIEKQIDNISNIITSKNKKKLRKKIVKASMIKNNEKIKNNKNNVKNLKKLIKKRKNESK